MARKLEVEIVGDAASLHRALGKSGKETDKFGSSLGRLGKAGVLAGGAAGIGALVVGLKIGISEFMEAQRVGAQTNAVIKSTGGIANVTAKGVSKLAESLMKKTGVDDEAIASGQNMLLTFTNIRNEVGKGKDVFDQATKAALDLSVATGKDLTSANVLVGKALNDPIKGLTALTRVGVSFSESQKEAIKSMVESGDTMGAQKMILAELNKEFGGSAEAIGKTLPGQINIMKESFSNFAGDLVAKTIPILERTIAWLRDHWPEIRAKFMAMWAAIQPALAAFGELIATVAGLIQKHWGTIGPIIEDVANVIKAQLKIITDVIQIFISVLKGDWSEAWEGVKTLVGDVIDSILATLTLAKNTLGAAAKKIGEAIKDGAVTGVTGIATAVWNVIKNIGSAITDALGAIANWGKDIGSKVKSGAVSGITGIASDVWNVIENIGGVISKAAGAISGWGKDLGGKLKDGAISALSGIGSAIVNQVKAAINALIGRVNSLLEFSIDLPNKIPGLPNEIRVDAPDIPRLAAGGIVTKPTLAVLGESGTEAVIPLGRGGAAGGAMTFNLVLDGRTLASILIDPLRNEAKLVSARTGRPAFS